MQRARFVSSGSVANTFLDALMSVAPVALAALAVLAALLVFVSPAAAQVGLERIEFVNGSVKAEGQSAVPGNALRFHLAGGDLDDNWSVVPAIEYWRDSDHFPEFGVEKITQRDWTVGADARYHVNVKKSWRPYVGGGFGLHLIKSTFDPVTGPSEQETSKKFAPNLLLGVDLPAASFIQSAVELNYQMVSGFRQFKINWGIGVKI
jgi:opacity protein-like surface antigen